MLAISRSQVSKIARKKQHGLPVLLPLIIAVGLALGSGFGLVWFDAQQTSSPPRRTILYAFFAGFPDTRFLAAGWAQPEHWGTWASGTHSEINLPFRESPQDLTLAFELDASVPSAKARAEEVMVSANGIEVGRLKFGRDRWYVRVVKSITIPRALVASGKTMTISLDIVRSHSSTQSGTTGEGLRIGLRSVAVSY